MGTTFSREQISRLLNKATQIQASIDRLGNAEGLTESELIELGAEVGLSKQAILEAINEVANTNQLHKKFEWIKGSSQLQFDQMIFGEINEATKEAIIAEIQAETGGIGKTNKATETQLDWEQRRSEVGYKHINLTAEENGRIRLRYNYNWLGLKLALSFVAPVIAMAITVLLGKGIGLNEYKGLFALAGMFMGFVGGRIYLKKYFEEQKAQFTMLKAKITAVFGKSETAFSTKNENTFAETTDANPLNSGALLDQINDDEAMTVEQTSAQELRQKLRND